MRRKLLRIGAGVAALLALLVGLGFWFLHSSWGHEFVRIRIERALGDVVTGKVRLGELDGDLLGEPSIASVEIRDARGRVVVQTQRITARYRLWPILRGQGVQVERLVIEAPQVVLAAEADGTWNLAHVFAPKQPSSGGLRVVIEALHAQRGRVVVEQAGTTTTIEGLALDGSFDAKKIVLESLDGTWTEDQQAKIHAEGSVVPGANGLALRGVHVSVGGNRVDSEQLALAGEAATGDLKLTLVGDELRPFLPTLPAGLGATLTLALRPEGTGTGAEVDATASGLRVDEIRTVQLTGHVGYAAGRGSGKLRVVVPAGELELAGAVVADKGSLRFDQVTLVGHGDRLARAGWQLDKVKLDGHIGGGWPLFDADVAVAVAEMKHENDTGGFDSYGALDGHVHISEGGQRIELTLHAGNPRTPIEADVRVTLSFAGEATTLRIVEARARTRRLIWEAGGGEVIVRKDSTTVRGLHLVSAAGRVDAEGELSGASQLRLRLTGVDFARLGSGLVIAGLPTSGRVDGRVTVSGTNEAPLVSLVADARGLQLRPTAQPLAVHLDGRLERGRAQLAATLTAPGVKLAAHLGAAVSDWRAVDLRALDEAQVTGEGIALADLWAALGLSDPLLGRVAALAARLEHGTTTLHLALEGVRPRSSSAAVDATLDATLHAGTLGAHVHIGEADVGSLDLEAESVAPRTLLDTAAWRALRPASLRRLDVRAQGLDLEAAQALLGLPLRVVGRADAELHLPLAGAATFSLAVAHAGLFGSDLRGSSRLTASAKDGQLGVDGTLRLPFVSLDYSLGAHVPRDLFDLDAWRALDDTALTRAKLRTSQVSLAQAPLPPAWRVSGGTAVASLELDEHGHTVVDVGLEGVRVHWLHRNLGAHLHAEIDERSSKATLDSSLGRDKLVHAEASAALGRASLRSGLAQLRSAAVHADARVDAFPIAVVADELELPLTLATKLGGSVSATATLDGSLDAPRLGATLALDHARVDTVSFAELGATWQWQAGRTTAHLHARQGDQGSFDADVATGGGGPTDATVRAHAFSLALLAPLVRATGGDWLMAAGGILDADLHATGSAAQPSVKGSATVRKGSLHLRDDSLPRLSNIELRLNPAGAHVDFAATAQSASGHLAIQDGSADLVGWIPSQAQARLLTDDLLVNIAGIPANATLAAHVKVVHDFQAHHWAIDARLDDSSIFVHADAALAGYGETEDVVYADELGGESHESLRLLISAREGAHLHVICNLGDIGRIDASATPNLAIRIDGGHVLVDGAVDVDADSDSHYAFMGVTYTLDAGRLAFTAGEPSPTIQATARKDYQTMVFTAQVTGTIAEPHVALKADPADYTQEQLLQILLGANPDLGDPGHASLGTSAVSAAANVAMKKLLPALSSHLAVGIEDVGDASTPERRYSLAWHGRWWALSVRHRATVDVTKNNNDAVLQLNLPALNWIVELSYGDRGAGNGDLLRLWRW